MDRRCTVSSIVPTLPNVLGRLQQCARSVKGQTRRGRCEWEHCHEDTPSCQTSATSAHAQRSPRAPLRAFARPALAGWGRDADTCSKLFELNP